MRLIRRWWFDRSGATAIEYCLIVLVLSLVIIGGIGQAFNAIQTLFEDSNHRLVTATQ